jgi:hypothetical protein
VLKHREIVEEEGGGLVAGGVGAPGDALDVTAAAVGPRLVEAAR